MKTEIFYNLISQTRLSLDFFLLFEKLRTGENDHKENRAVT